VSLSQYSPASTSGHRAIPPPAIELDGVSKNFGSFRTVAALRDVTAEFASGRMIALLGDNGAGKSTLLRIIAGLLEATRGRVLVLGARNLRDVRQQVGYMPHAALLYDDMSGLENLRYFAALYGVHGGGPCEAAIRLVGLDPDLDRRVSQYSQGMRQRMSLARAVVHDPRLLLLDEPFSNVDVPSARHMVEVLAGMRDAGKTIVVVTHQPALLQGVADEFVIMAAGKIAARLQSLPDATEAAPAMSARELKARQN
jgi:ABC-type multidrug transport system ATPase subunit